MENLALTSNTPGTGAAADLLTRIAVDPGLDERYPNGTILIPSDSPDAPSLIAAAVDERRPIALVFADGSDFVARPPEVTGLALAVVLGLLWLADHLGRRSRESMFVPREWVTEYHAAREQQPVA